VNYWNGDGWGGGFPTERGASSLSEFDGQTDRLISAILATDADVIGLMELENDGYGANSAIPDLVDALNAVPSVVTYSFIDPGTAQLGAGVIAVGLIYRYVIP